MQARVLLTFTALAALVASGCVTPQAPVETASATLAEGLDELGRAPQLFGGHVFSTLTGKTAGGITIHADVWLPDTASVLPGAADVPTTFPTILIASPYWGSGTGGATNGYMPYAYWIKEAVPRGYAVVFGDNAGNGGSGGCWDFMGPNEQEASVGLVEMIAEQPWSDGKVGMIGISYDGMTQIMASSRVAEHLVTVVPVAPLTHAYAGLYQGGVHYGGNWWATTSIYTAFSVVPPFENDERMPGWAERMAETPACVGQNAVMGNDPTGGYSAFFQARDFRPMAPDVKASVFFIQGFLDANVKPDNAFPWWSDITTSKKLWLGQWFHQFPTASASGREDMYVTINRWFDHELKGIQNGILDEPAVDVQNSLGEWRHEATWPPADVNEALMFLGSSKLGVEASEGTAVIGGPGGLANRYTNTPLDGVAYFETEEFDAPVRIAGIPTFTGDIRSNSAAGQLVARLYDVSSSSVRMISQGAFNLMLHEDEKAPTTLSPGQKVNVHFALYPTDFVVESGHRIVLELSTQQTDTWYNADATTARLTIDYGGEAGARVMLPTVVRDDASTFLVACGTPISKAVPSCYDKDREDAGIPS